MHRRHNRFHNEDGQAVAEFALVLPALMLILLAIMQCGIVFKDYIELTDAVRAGARRGAVSRNTSNPKAVTEAAVASAAKLGPGLQVTATSTWKPGEEVSVQGRYPWKLRLLKIVVADGWLVSTTKERVE
jgi:Flp pilus assembly protein TadG